MRRYLVLLLVLFLPAQAVVAAGASYCSHEEHPSSFHIGHHTHSHDLGGLQLERGHPLLADHSDCPFLYMNFIAVPHTPTSLTFTAGAAPVPVAHLSLLPSVPAHRPERPQWLPAV